MKESNSLASYVTRLMSEKAISGYTIQKRSQGAISQSYANRIKKGEIPSPSTVKLQALALGLDVPEAELFAAVRGTGPDQQELTHEKLHSIDLMYRRMSGKKRKKADYLIELAEREIKRLSRS